MRAVGLYLPPELSGAPGDASGGDPEQAIRHYCAQNGHQLVAFFTATASEPASSAFDRMVASFKGPAGRPALVVVPGSAHFAPDLETTVARLLELRKLGTDARCADVDLPDLVLNAIEHLSLRGRLAARERRIRRSVLAKAARGEVLGRTPFGYAAGIDGVLKPAPGEAEVVRNIFMWYSGQQPRPPAISSIPAPSQPAGQVAGIGLRLIAQRLNEQGIRTRQRLPWTPVAVANILRNPSYLGMYSRYNNWIGRAHEPLVDRAVFNMAQATLTARKPRRRKSAGEPFALGGALTCGVCGRGLFGLTRRRSWANRDGARQSAVYRYYECSNRPPRKVRQESGDHPSWPADKLEVAVSEVLGQSPPPVVVAAGGEGVEVARRRRVAAAERQFMESLRSVAAGRGRLESLQGALELLAAARSQAGAPAGPGPTPAQAGPAMGEGTADDGAVTVRQRLDSLAVKLVVYSDRVEIGRRKRA